MTPIGREARSGPEARPADPPLPAQESHMAAAKPGSSATSLFLPLFLAVLTLLAVPAPGACQTEESAAPEMEVTPDHQAIQGWTVPPGRGPP